MIRPPPRSTLFPYPALFRSAGVVVGISGAVFKGSGVGILLVFVLACAALWFTIFVACGYGVTTPGVVLEELGRDRKSTRLNSSHGYIPYAAFCLKKKKDVQD